ncbi:MAG: hypothetical protein M1832_002786 [Thelocarpon impressellum]|nr:MAG: hypothetical protein M1832_002786 [Thelocarpon impressellum]
MGPGHGHGHGATGDRDSTAPGQQQRPAMIPSASAPAGRVPRLPLQDVSQYTDNYIPLAAVTATSTTLAELAHLVRLQAYQDQKRSQSRVKLHRCLVASALSARLERCGELVHRTLVDNFRSDDKKSFATLYNAIHDVRNSCDATRRYASLEPDLDLGRSKLSRAATPPRTFSTFMHEMPPRTRDDILGFLSRIRTEPDFLASRIASLSTSELASLTAFHHSLDPVDSVMPLQSRGKTLGSAVSRASAHLPTPVERLLSFQRHDPLSALLFTVFANSSGPDSAEDLRRTDVWSTTCARLITEGASGGEHFMRVVLNTWAAMREWPAKGNLELYLMKALQDGAFLLERVEDLPTGVKPPAEPRTTKDAIAADEFYDAAVKKLFEVIDDEPSAGGIPEGVLELGNAILRKLEDPKKQRTAQTFIVSKWFFSTFLLNALVHPESHGIMTGHHISEYARQKILKEIASRASKHVWDMTISWKQAAPILPEIRAHIDSILARFRNPRSKRSRPVLLPAKAITSPRETIEVQPFLVVCPSDIITIVNTLFPERRPSSSSLERDMHHRGLRSAASSISGISLPLQANPQSGSVLETGSLLSNSGSSVTSDATSREPLLDGLGHSTDGRSSFTSFGSRETLQNIQKPTSEDYGHKMRSRVAEMSHQLGMEATTGSCHPCAERWAVLYVSPDGQDLMIRMRKDWDDDEDEDDDSPDSDSEDEITVDRSDLERDYHQLKAAITKLVEEYEIPKELAPESEFKGFSNRASALGRKSIKAGSSKATSVVAANTLSKNPYHSQSHLSAMIASQKQAVPERSRPHHVRASSLRETSQSEQEAPSVLLTMLEAAMSQCQARSDFVAAHLYWKTLQQLRRLASSSLTRNGFASLLNYFSRGPRDSLGKAASAIEEFEAWFVWLKQSQERHDAAVEEMMLQIKEMRDKMWYVTDVKNSAAYEEAKNIAIALKTMGQPPRSVQTKTAATARSRLSAKPSTNNFLLKTETQIMDLMTASGEQGGPHKLSDDQSEMTNKWLTQYGVENFCKGEERIHRFCLEVDKCVNKLVGNDILDGPVLWSSELYYRDKRILDSGRQKGDLFLTGVGTLSIAGDEEYETEYGRPGPRSLDHASRPSTRDLRSVSARNTSQQSFDSGKWSGARGGTTADIMDAQDYFGMASPVLSIDSTKTFWSPFQTQAQSSTTASSIRPRTASSGNDTVMLKHSESVKLDKRRFLLDLKQNLTGLLLSDIGTLVWSHGSETDSWFSGELGEECIQRKVEKERRRRRALAKRRSMKSLRSGKADGRANAVEVLGRGERGQPAAPVATLEHAAPGVHSTEETTSSSSDATAKSSGMAAAKKAGLLDFPYNVAFRRLLDKFSTHPNPFTKLHALYELELLIVASLSSRSGRSYGVSGRRDTLPTAPISPTLGSMGDLSHREKGVHIARARNLEETIANCESRRSHTMAASGQGSALRSPSSGTRSPHGHGPPSTDMIVEVLQGLFRDAAIRPKSLFRDLQFIASFVPFPILDKTERGKAFWDAGLAALGLKQDVCRMMVEIADDIVAYHTKNRSLSPERRAVEDQASSELARFSMEDAARMWSITAKEGDPVAQRELAIFYLTHPDLLARTTLPLTRPRDTFKAQVMSQRNEDPMRSDPATMCVAYHWMELSSQGGDDLARKYLRAREELNALP